MDFIESLANNKFHIVCYSIKGCFSSVKMAEYSPSVFDHKLAAYVVFGSGG